MTSYSIKDLEKYSGVKAHTIRMWEKRYGLIKPLRTETNIRYYDETQLKFLLNVSALLANDYKISKIGKFSEEEFQRELRKIYGKSEKDLSESAIHLKMNNLIMAMMELSENKFEKTFSTSVIKRGFELTLIDVLCPFLTKVGIMSRTGEINNAHEHFIYQVIRQKVFVAIDSLPLAPENGESYLLYLPEVKQRDLFILISYYLIKTRGKSVTFLGQNISPDALEMVVKLKNPTKIMTFISTPANPDETADYMKLLRKMFPNIRLLVAGTPGFMKKLEYPENTLYIDNFREMIEEIEKKTK